MYHPLYHFEIQYTVSSVCFLHFSCSSAVSLLYFLKPQIRTLLICLNFFLLFVYNISFLHSSDPEAIWEKGQIPVRWTEQRSSDHITAASGWCTNWRNSKKEVRHLPTSICLHLPSFFFDFTFPRHLFPPSS